MLLRNVVRATICTMYGYTFNKSGERTGTKDTVSYSALSLWSKDKQGYRAHYYEGAPGFTSPYTVFGTEIHRKVEHGEITIPGVNHDDYMHERKVEAILAGVPVLGYIDMCHKETNAVIDLKTSKNPWSLSDVQKLDQLPLYIALLREHHEKVSLWSSVIWIETAWVHDEATTVSVGSFEAECDSNRRLTITDRAPVVLKRRMYNYDIDRVTEWVKVTADEIARDFASYKLSTGTH